MTVQHYFESLTQPEIKTYNKYWKSVAPKTDDEVLRRWLFAYASIHTTWEGNVRGYNAIKNFDEWIDDRDLLGVKLFESKCGMHNKRQEYIWDFAQDFRNNVSDYKKQKNESWVDFRNRLTKKCRGIGIAKVSFTLEMCFPDKADVVCLDTHMIQLYNLKLQKFDGGKGKLVYEEHENDWISRSKALRASPYIARCIFWDRKQGKCDSRYWSHVLEG